MSELQETTFNFNCLLVWLQLTKVNEIAELKAQISSLTSKVLQLSIPERTPSSQLNDNPTETVIVPDPPLATKPDPPIQQINSTSVITNPRKYNVVLFGLDEYPKGTKKYDRDQSDLKNSSQFFLN